MNNIGAGIVAIFLIVAYYIFLIKADELYKKHKKKNIMNLKGSKTEKNLFEALQGEALAHLKYQFYRSKISNYSKEYEAILDEIVHNEKEHGKIWFKQLHDGEIPSDVENLLDAYIGEKHEHIEMYPHFSRVAKEEGFDEIARLFNEVAKIEGKHMEKFDELLNNIKDENTFVSDNEVEWKCLNCGYIYDGNEAMDECPVCKHPRKYFVK